MAKKYLICDEFGENFCGVSFDEDIVKFEFDSVTLNGNISDWKQFGRIVEMADLWSEELKYVADRCKDINFTIFIENPDGTGKGILFEGYGNKGQSLELGSLAECYNDCETCTICHNYWAIEYDEENEDWYSDCLNCEGCHEHPCTKANGREHLDYIINHFRGN